MQSWTFSSAGPDQPDREDWPGPGDHSEGEEDGEDPTGPEPVLQSAYGGRHAGLPSENVKVRWDRVEELSPI